MVRNDAGVHNYREFQDNDKLQLGVIRSFLYSPSANRLLDRLQQANRVSQAGGLEPLYQTLLQDQIQGMIIEPFDFPALQEKKIRAMSTILEFDDPAVPHGLIMSKKSIPPEQQKLWASLIDGMRADGTMLRIFEKYFSHELAARMVNF